MYCNQCASYNCVHLMQAGMSQMAAQQQMGMTSYYDMIRNQAGLQMAQELKKELERKISNKKLLLLRTK